MKKEFMSNLDAIKNMSLDEMAYFLDCVYATGLNDGIYFAKLSDKGDDSDVLDECPYSEEWLSDEAEKATRCVFSDDGDANLPDFFVKAVFRVAGLDYDNTENE